MAAAPLMLFAVLRGPELRFEYVSPAYAQLVPERSLWGVSFRDAFPSAAAGGAEAALLRVLESGATWHIDPSAPPIASVPGAMWEGEAVRLPGSAGDAAAITLCARDVSPNFRHEELARTDEALRTAHARLEATLDSITDGVLVMDREWRYTYVSARAGKSLGMGPESLVGGRVWDLFPHARGTKFYDEYHRAMATMQPVTFEEFYPEPLHQWIECHCFPSAESLTVYFRDITKRRRSEEALHQSTAVLRAISDASDDVIYAKDREGRLLFANPATLELVGKPANQVLGHTDAEFLADEATAREVMANDRRIMAAATPLNVEEMVALPSGERRTWLSQKMPMRDEAGSVVGLLGISRDITQRKLAEEALRASEGLQAFLVRLGDTIHPLAGSVAVQSAAARLLREHLEASRAHYAEVEPDGEHAIVATDNASGVPDRAGRYALADFPRLADELRGARTFIVDDVTAETRLGPAEKATYLAQPVAAFVSVPILKQGRLKALLSVGRASPHAWSKDEVRLIEETAARTWEAVLRAQAEKALRASEERYRQALESMSEGYAILSPDWTYLFVNKANAEQAHSSPEDMVGRSMLEVIPGVEKSPFFEAYRRCMEERTPQRLEAGFTFQDGSSAWFEAVAEPVNEGILVRAQDITARKQAEEALREADRRKDEFIAVLAHELRNPLAPVRSAVEILRQVGPTEPRLIHAREVIDRQVTHMARLIDDLLDVSRIARGKLALQRERCDVAEIVRQTAGDYRSNLEATGLNLDFEAPVTPLWVDGDPVRLAQMVGNLLNNAGRFTNRGGRVQVHVARSGPWVEVTVADTGVGIEPTLLSRLFDPFSQAEQDLARTKGGLGLGLALTKGLVELHGGEITAESPGAGRGSTFRLRLPASGVPAEQTVGPARPAQRALRILVVEDNHDAAEMLGQLLALTGHEVKLAFDAVTALDLARAFRPQVIISDLGLPGELDGYGFARALRSEEAQRGVYLIALSGYASEEARRRSSAAGFDAHLAKPPDLAKLEATLAAASQPCATR